jgi:hypothetical protein
MHPGDSVTENLYSFSLLQKSNSKYSIQVVL